MKGLPLDTLSGELQKVHQRHNRAPIKAIKNPDEKLGPWKKYMIATCREDFSFLEHFRELPIKAFARFSFDDLCKVFLSQNGTSIDKSVEDFFRDDGQYEIVRKIISSMWKWGFGKGTWNEIVDTYDNIRHFTFSDDHDFEIRLDHSTYDNEFSPSKYHRIFLDGCFGFFVYHKKRHVLTIGFSIMEKKRLLIQQVQSAMRSGNRSLYKIPRNRPEFVIDLFRRNFPGYRLYLIDGCSLVEKTIADYRGQLRRGHALCNKYKLWLKTATEESARDYRRYLIDTEQECRDFEERIAHLVPEKVRIATFYGNIGRFNLGDSSIARFGMTHREVVK